ncbi:MAG: hypothetical protein AAFX40_17570, partial [Cyanobacteria bacterium J06639_1]
MIAAVHLVPNPFADGIMIQTLQKILGDPNDRKVRLYRPNVKMINALEIETSSLSDEQLRAKTVEFKQRL